MRWWVLSCFFLVLACGNKTGEQTASQTTPSNEIDSSASAKEDTDTNMNTVADTASYQSHAPAVKKPSGIYQFVFPYDNKTKILHTIAFYPTSFRLQEEYLGKKDSVVITEGTWAPSQGFIWLYEGHVARGRYTWKGDTLEYYSPRMKKTFSLTKQTPASNNKVWMDKKAQGAILFAIGTEPFWSVEVNKQDSIILSMPDWTEPLRVKISTTSLEKNTTIYSAATDSLRVTVHPYFCSDGMSDFIYANKVTVTHRGKTYQGCGMSF